jgi:hypothetical protein
MAHGSNCTRCGGLTIPDMIRDCGSISLGWRCLLCGDLVDSVILRNRAALLAGTVSEEDESIWDEDSSIGTAVMPIGGVY